jgi:hypothetical protein
MVGSSCFTHATSLGVRIVSDFPPVIRTISRSLRLQVAQNCPDYPGVRISGTGLPREHCLWKNIDRTVNDGSRMYNQEKKNNKNNNNEAQTRLYSFKL